MTNCAPPTPSRLAAYARAACGLAACGLAACGGAAGGPAGAGAARIGPTPLGLADLPPAADAPYELADDRDLADERARFDAMDAGDPERDALRAALAAEYARRLDDAMSPGNQAGNRAAYEHLVSLVGLWSPAEIDGDPAAGAGRSTLAAGLAPHLPRVHELRRRFARSASDAEVTVALAVLAAAAPDGDVYAREIDDVFAFADALSVSVYGQGAERARPLDILEEAVQAFPSRLVVDRLVALHRERQRAMQERFVRHGADVALIRAHGATLGHTAWRIVRALARAGRLGEAPAATADVRGVGDDPALRGLVDRALGRGEPKDWIALAAAFRAGNRTTDQAAALAILRAGVARRPRSSELLIEAAAVARQLENLPLSIALLERAVALAPDDRDATGELAELYRIRVSALAFGERPLAAAAALRSLEAFHARAAKRWPEQPLASDLADAYAAMGQGLVNLGHLTEAQRYLERSIGLRPTFEALESLGTIALKQDRFADASKWFDRGLQLPVSSVQAQVSRAKIRRLAGDARDGAGDRDGARAHWARSMQLWAGIGDAWELPTALKAELVIETGKAHWSLGDRDAALSAFDLAIDLDPDGAATHSAVVAFLIVRDEYDRALDAYHRALGSAAISDYFKVYMSLWVLTEARRTGVAEDPLAVDYLAGRDGRLWYDDLARMASGRSTPRAIRDRATTRGRRAELLYYAAVLGQGDYTASETRSLLAGVLATDMVMFFEYDMAKHWLAHGLRGQAGTSAR